MKRFKLANGGTIASCKQPLQNKDFDRIEISVITSYKGIDFNDFDVFLFNPSTHMMRKQHSGELYISVSPCRGNIDLSKYGNGIQYKASCGRAILRHIDTNYFRINQTLHPGRNYLDMLRIIDEGDMQMNTPRGSNGPAGIGLDGSCTLDRLLRPDNYIDYFSDNDYGPVDHSVTLHQSGGGYFDWLYNVIVIAMWKGPFRRHMKKMSNLYSYRIPMSTNEL